MDALIARQSARAMDRRLTELSRKVVSAMEARDAAGLTDLRRQIESLIRDIDAWRSTAPDPLGVNLMYGRILQLSQVIAQARSDTQ